MTVNCEGCTRLCCISFKKHQTWEDPAPKLGHSFVRSSSPEVRWCTFHSVSQNPRHTYLLLACLYCVIFWFSRAATSSRFRVFWPHVRQWTSSETFSFFYKLGFNYYIFLNAKFLNILLFSLFVSVTILLNPFMQIYHRPQMTTDVYQTWYNPVSNLTGWFPHFVWCLFCCPWLFIQYIHSYVQPSILVNTISQ